MHAQLKLHQSPPRSFLLNPASEEFEDAMSVIETYIDPEPGESLRSLVYRMAGRCEERITNLELAGAAIVEAWSCFQKGVPANHSIEPAVKAFEEYIGEQWP